MTNSVANISLYIPHVFKNITKDRISEVFFKLDFGKVKRVDLVLKQGQDKCIYNSAYIHFDYWNVSEMTTTFQERLKNPNKQTRVVYDDPWHWVVLENKSTPTVKGRKICIQLDEDANIPFNKQKNGEKKVVDLEDLDSCKRKLEFDESYNLVDTKYVNILEKQNSYLHEQLEQTKETLLTWRSQYDYVYCTNDMLADENFQLKERIRELETNFNMVENVNKHLKDEVECFKNREWIEMV